ncbi:MAG: hypothetical protein RMJ43_01030 [Chloroherpetonaceae bacterium]|nr:hypothetical protein [Chthonomonadaceae bacterium]MDW8206392.1 hypothetical protein [Chloroherpetonaceae bacterium]
MMLETHEQEILARLDRIIALLERIAPPQGPTPQAASVTHAIVSPPGSAGQDLDTEPAGAPVYDVDPGILALLEGRGIRIKTVPPRNAADRTIDSLAQYVGDNYHRVKDLLAKIKRTMQRGDTFVESLQERTQEDVTVNCQLCTRLHALAFLAEYKYEKSPKFLIRARSASLPAAQKFFSGQWLERFIALCVQRVLERRQLLADSALLANPQIILPNGNDFELDLIVRVRDDFYWIEAKTGAYQDYVQKYSRFARILGLDYVHSIMVLTDVSNECCDSLSSLFEMTVTNAESFEALFAHSVDCYLSGRAPGGL